MSQYTSYYLYQKYEKIGDQDPIPCYPNVYSIDGDGTMQTVIKTDNDPLCGYVPPSEPMYRWYQIPITTDYICDECPEPMYRWAKAATTDYVCVGVDKHYKEYYQVSYDSGTTWQNVTPTSSRTSSDVIEYNSTDCGYSPSGGTKFSATYNDSTSYSAACDSNTTLTSATTRAHSTSYTAMTSAEIGDCVTSIGNNAFDTCEFLSSVTIPNSVTSIGNGAFRNCGRLPSITIPSGVTSIGSQTFESCSNLARLNSDVDGVFNIPSGVTSIDYYAFLGCGSPTSITIPNSVTSIGYGAFSSCSNLESFEIPSGVTSIGHDTFAYCRSLISVTIPNSITSIGYWAFAYCSGLTSVDIPDSVTSIDYLAFRNCSGLTSCTIGSGITNIGASAFTSCTSLTSITVEATTPPTLERRVFDDTNNCPIYVPCASISTYKSAWSDYANRIQGIPPCGYTQRWVNLDPSTDYYCEGTTKYYKQQKQETYDSGSTWSWVIPSEYQKGDVIEYNSTDCGYTPSGGTKFSAVYYDSTTYSAACDSETELTTATTRAHSTSHTAMTSAEIGDCVTSIGNSAFYNCYRLTNIEIPSGITSIKYRAFYNCYSLTSVTIPDSVTSIDDGAFRNCTSLTSVIVEATTPPSLPSLSNEVFDNTNNCPIYVLEESVDRYKRARGWSTYASRIEAIP